MLIGKYEKIWEKYEKIWGERKVDEGEDDKKRMWQHNWFPDRINWETESLFFIHFSSRSKIVWSDIKVLLSYNIKQLSSSIWA